MRVFTTDELNDLVAQGQALGYVGLGTKTIRICTHGKRVETGDALGHYHYPHGPFSFDYDPCLDPAQSHRVFHASLVPYQELF